MTRVCIICEGPTEMKFVATVMTESFAVQGIYLEPLLIQTSKGHRGGALNYDRVKPALCHALNQSSAPFVTTFFDLYRLDKRFPGFDISQRQNDLTKKLNTICEALHQDITQASGCAPTRFIPYIQAHEFEALLFSDIQILTSMELSWARAYDVLQQVRQSVISPEHINHGEATKPKARLTAALHQPQFANTGNGILAAKHMGLAKIESQCHHFAAWLRQLRALAPP